jgi:hypothetical protein
VEAFRHLRISFWIAAIGAVALYVFFVSLGGVSPAEVGGVTIAVLSLAILFTLRNLRVAGELAARGGDPRLRRTRNRMRERRGF